MGKGPRKPTGTTGALEISPGTKSARFLRLDFPERKSEVEKFIVSKLVTPSSPLGELYKLVGSPAQNAEQDFDFTITTESGAESLELMEVAILDNTGFDKASFRYIQGDIADAICTRLQRKAERYGSAPSGTLHLLLYSTDQRFNLSNDVWWLVAKWASQAKHPFATVVSVVFLDDTHADGKIVYPQPGRDFSKVDENVVRKKTILLADLRRFEVGPDGSVTIPLGPVLPPADDESSA